MASASESSTTASYPNPSPEPQTDSNSSTDSHNPQDWLSGHIGTYAFRIRVFNKPGLLVGIAAAVLGLICTVLTIMVIVRKKIRKRGLTHSQKTVSDTDLGDFQTKASQNHHDMFNPTNEFCKRRPTTFEKQLARLWAQQNNVKFNALAGPCVSIAPREDEDGSNASSHASDSKAPDERSPSQQSSFRSSIKTKSSHSHRAV